MSVGCLPGHWTRCKRPDAVYMLIESRRMTLLNVLQVKFCALLSCNLQCFDCMAQSVSADVPAALQEKSRTSLNPKIKDYFVAARHVSLPWTRLIKSTPPPPSYWQSILILSSRPRVSVQVAIFLHLSLSRRYKLLSFFPIRSTFPAHLDLLDLTTNHLCERCQLTIWRSLPL